MMKSTQRKEYLDLLRGIAMISIVLGHLGVSSIIHVVFTYHLPVFFLITGYFTREGQPLSALVRKRARTLLVPYAICCMIIIVLRVLWYGIRGGSGASSEAVQWILASLYASGTVGLIPTGIISIGAIWFLWATFWACIFLNLILRMPDKFRIAAVLGIFLAGYYSARKFLLPLDIQPAACALLYLYVGYLVRRYEASLLQMGMEWRISVLALAAVVWISFILHFQGFWIVGCNFGNGAEDIVASLCACLVLTVICFWLDRISDRAQKDAPTPDRVHERSAFPGQLIKWIAFLGRYSIVILFMHIIELDVFPYNGILKRLNGHGMPVSLNLAVMILLKFLIIISGSIILVRTKAGRRIFGFRDPEEKA
ncbi:acyltransferase family protein [Bilifractor sp. LCP19S3_H10]|uniref:acyltransferase family protein n=1 Tax=Bilifractor sp. LCP19S3_H10 TaxID=3438736 RepID=UPI003F91D878